MRWWTAADPTDNDNKAMTLTRDHLTELTAGSTGGGAAHRRVIDDVGDWLDGLDYGVRPTLRALGELLVGVAERETAENAERFTARCLGVPDCGYLLDEARNLNPVSRLTVALAVLHG